MKEGQAVKKIRNLLKDFDRSVKRADKQTWHLKWSASHKKERINNMLQIERTLQECITKFHQENQYLFEAKPNMKRTIKSYKSQLTKPVEQYATDRYGIPTSPNARNYVNAVKTLNNTIEVVEWAREAVERTLSEAVNKTQILAKLHQEKHELEKQIKTERLNAIQEQTIIAQQIVQYASQVKWDDAQIEDTLAKDIDTIEKFKLILPALREIKQVSHKLPDLLEITIDSDITPVNQQQINTAITEERFKLELADNPSNHLYFNRKLLRNLMRSIKNISPQIHISNGEKNLLSCKHELGYVNLYATA